MLDEAGRVLAQRSFERGVLTVAPGQFPQVFGQCFADWSTQPGVLCLMSGMVGSKQGWREAPYCACSAGFAQIAAKLTWLEPGRMALVPGLSCEHPGLPAPSEPATAPDVMRGEETQVLGALQLLGIEDAVMVLPGTHSKWVQVRGRRVESFSTFMTGELFSLLRRHSILARTLPTADPPPDDEAFAWGVKVALRGTSLLHTAFSTRTLALFDRVPGARLADYLSGLVIGEELRAQPLAPNARVVIIGAKHLTRRYQQALALKNQAAQCLGQEATWAGLRAIADSISHNLAEAS